MRKIFSLAVFLVMSSSLAAGLIGTERSVNESNFCKKYACKFISSKVETTTYGANNEKTTGYKAFTYNLNNGGELYVARRSNKIWLVSVKFVGADKIEYIYYKGDKFAEEFSLSFSGNRPTESINGTCFTPTMMEDGITMDRLAKNITCTTIFNHPKTREAFTFDITVGK